jgi:hypothetical protein
LLLILLFLLTGSWTFYFFCSLHSLLNHLLLLDNWLCYYLKQFCFFLHLKV